MMRNITDLIWAYIYVERKPSLDLKPRCQGEEKVFLFMTGAFVKAINTLAGRLYQAAL